MQSATIRAGALGKARGKIGMEYATQQSFQSH